MNSRTYLLSRQEISSITEEQRNTYLEPDDDRGFDLPIETNPGNIKAAYFTYDIKLKESKQDDDDKENSFESTRTVDYLLSEEFDYYSDFKVRIDLPTLKVKDESSNLIKYVDNILPTIIQSCCIVVGNKEYFYFDSASLLIQSNYNTETYHEESIKRSLGIEKRIFSTIAEGVSFEYKLPLFANSFEHHENQISRFRIPNNKVYIRICYATHLSSVLRMCNADEVDDNFERVVIDYNVIEGLPEKNKNIHQPVVVATVRAIPELYKEQVCCQNPKYFLQQNVIKKIATINSVKFGVRKEIPLSVKNTLIKGLFFVAEEKNTSKRDPFLWGYSTKDGYEDCIYKITVNVSVDNHSVNKFESFKDNFSKEHCHYKRVPFIPGIRAIPYCIHPFERDFQSNLENPCDISIILGDYKNTTPPLSSERDVSAVSWLNTTKKSFTVTIYCITEETLNFTTFTEHKDDDDDNNTY